jgi:thymidylate synthase (FAD)
VESCKELYDELERNGVAKEQCRVILPLCLETQFIWTGSLAAFLHLWKLRLKQDAQEETRLLASMMLDEVRNIPGSPFAHTLGAFGF